MSRKHIIIITSVTFVILITVLVVGHFQLKAGVNAAYEYLSTRTLRYGTTSGPGLSDAYMLYISEKNKEKGTRGEVYYPCPSGYECKDLLIPNLSFSADWYKFDHCEGGAGCMDVVRDLLKASGIEDLETYIQERRVKSEPIGDDKPFVHILSENPDDKPAIELLKYAFWIVHSRFDYDSYKNDLLKSIADEFKVQEASDLYEAVNSLYVKYQPKSVVKSYDSPPVTYNKKWFEVADLVSKERKYDQAIQLSNNDPFALALIASSIYKDTQDKSKAVELLERAYTQIQPSMKDREALVQRIIKSYIEMDDPQKAYQLFKESGIIEIEGFSSLPMIEFFSKQQELDIAFELVGKTLFDDVKAAGLVRIAKYIDNEKPLERKYKVILENLMKSVSQ